jgi:microcystin-dependent protein
VADQFLGEIRAFPFNFAPKGWAVCNGQVLPLAQNTALFSILGVYFGGDGKSTFGLPNLPGCAPMHPGAGNGLTSRFLGETGGETSVTLLATEIPMHNHSLMSSTSPADGPSPAGAANARVTGATPYVPPAGATLVSMAAGAIQPTGGSLPHNNMQPYLTVSFCIALQGIYPQRS